MFANYKRVPTVELAGYADQVRGTSEAGFPCGSEIRDGLSLGSLFRSVRSGSEMPATMHCGDAFGEEIAICRNCYAEYDHQKNGEVESIPLRGSRADVEAENELEKSSCGNNKFVAIAKEHPYLAAGIGVLATAGVMCVAIAIYQGTSSQAENAASSNQATTAPASGKTTTAPASGKTTTAPASGKTTTAPASSKTTSTPASSEITTAPASSKTTSAPVSSETTSALAGSKTTSVSSEMTSAPASSQAPNATMTTQVSNATLTSQAPNTTLTPLVTTESPEVIKQRLANCTSIAFNCFVSTTCSGTKVIVENTATNETVNLQSASGNDRFFCKEPIVPSDSRVGCKDGNGSDCQPLKVYFEGGSSNSIELHAPATRHHINRVRINAENKSEEPVVATYKECTNSTCTDTTKTLNAGAKKAVNFVLDPDYKGFGVTFANQAKTKSVNITSFASDGLLKTLDTDPRYAKRTYEGNFTITNLDSSSGVKLDADLGNSTVTNS